MGTARHHELFRTPPAIPGPVEDPHSPAARARNSQPHVTDGCARVTATEHATEQAPLRRAADHESGHLPLRCRMKCEEPVREPVRLGLPFAPILQRADRMTVLVTNVVRLRFLASDELARVDTVRLVTKPEPWTAGTSSHVSSIASGRRVRRRRS